MVEDTCNILIVDIGYSYSMNIQTKTVYFGTLCFVIILFLVIVQIIEPTAHKTRNDNDRFGFLKFKVYNKDINSLIIIIQKVE